MVVGELAEPVDLLVIGGGPGGYTAAVRAAQLGRSVVLVERHDGGNGLGGTCLHVGCIPSKALIELAEAKTGLRRLAGRGLAADDVRVDLAAFQADKSAMVGRLAAGVGRLLAGHGVRVLSGEARLSGPQRAVVQRPGHASTFLEYRDVILATGSRPAELEALPRDGRRVLDSTDALSLTELPRSIAVVGGGVIGLELASAFHALGAAVTVVELADRLVPDLDAKISATIRRALLRRGIQVLCSARVLGDDGSNLVVAGDREEQRIPADAVITAVGRRRNSENLGLERAGVDVLANGAVKVDGRLLAAPQVAAIGDLTEGLSLAHKAMAEGAVAAEALSGLPSEFDPAAIPAVVYTDPEIAVAGLGEDSAPDGVAVTSVPIGITARSATMGTTEGLVRVLSDPASGAVVGVQIVGRHASELIAEGVLAIEMGATVEDLAHTIHAHPTLSEAVFEVARRAFGTPLHSPV